jgi:hypothetical protein
VLLLFSGNMLIVGIGTPEMLSVLEHVHIGITGFTRCYGASSWLHP